MKISLKYFIGYLIIFTVGSTLIMLYTLEALRPVNINITEKSQFLQSILCSKIRTTIAGTLEPLHITISQSSSQQVQDHNSHKSELSTEESTHEGNQNDVVEGRDNGKQKRENLPDFSNIDEVLSSLKNEYKGETNFKPEEEMYKLANLTPYEEKLSIYNSKDYKLLKELFPVHKKQNILYEDRILKQLRVKLKETERKIILVYHYDNNLKTAVLENSGCEITNCRITNNKRELPKAHAVIFRNQPTRLKRPENRSNQLWIYQQLESPLNTGLFQIPMNMFNWTATYRTDSVLNTPYAKFQPYVNISIFPAKPPRNFAEGKTKLAAWFVSNCEGRNGRKNYVKELQKYAQIDIYGFCGPLKCARTSQDCFEMLKRHYKFYLSFENTNCRDYITEKFFLNALRNDVIPIVMGAHPDDYKKLSPPYSYIHVDDFNSPRQLAEYMHILDRNDDLYNQYFRWKGTGEFINTKFICRLCAMVQVAPLFPMWYKDFNRWWYNSTCVRKPPHGKWATWRDQSRLTYLQPNKKYTDEELYEIMM